MIFWLFSRWVTSKSLSLRNLFEKWVTHDSITSKKGPFLLTNSILKWPFFQLTFDFMKEFFLKLPFFSYWLNFEVTLFTTWQFLEVTYFRVIYSTMTFFQSGTYFEVAFIQSEQFFEVVLTLKLFVEKINLQKGYFDGWLGPEFFDIY